MRALANAASSGRWSPLVIVLAVGLYALARSFGLVGSMFGLVLAHTMLALPYVVLNVGGRCRSARSGAWRWPRAGLGAGPWRAFRTVTLPSILPGIVGGGVFAFVTSFDEVVLAVFLAGPSGQTLPVRIWEELRVEYTPIVAVAATINADRAGSLGSAMARLGGIVEGDMSALAFRGIAEALRRPRGARPARSSRAAQAATARPLGLRQDDAAQHMRLLYG